GVTISRTGKGSSAEEDMLSSFMSDSDGIRDRGDSVAVAVATVRVCAVRSGLTSLERVTLLCGK
ncbi:hypothetical protein, partial [Streptomyces sp. NRAIS3]